MLLTTENIILIGALLLLVSVFAGKVAYRFGAPALLLFLGVGMLFGLRLISFNSAPVAQFVGMVALCIILFSGGMDTRYRAIRPVIGPGVVLATVGVALTALIVCGMVYLMTKNGFVSLILAAMLEAGLIGGYLWDSSRFEGLFPQIISQLSLFARFYTIVNGVFDVTAIVYYLSVTGFFLFLSVQSLEKRRWSE